MSMVVKKIKGEPISVFLCDRCGKKISANGVLQKTAKHIISASIPEINGKEFCKDCYKHI